MTMGSIPSPPGGAFHLGPLEFRAYGLMIALGALVAVWWIQKRWQARGGSPDDISAVAFWAILAGLVGSRLYHVATDWRSSGVAGRTRPPFGKVAWVYPAA